MASELPEPIPFHRPAIGEREIAAAVEVLRSGWLTTGARSHAFEDAFRERLGVRHALAVNSATAALHLALEGFGIGTGDEVAIPTYTFTACGEVCAYLGARPVLTDVGEDYLMGAEQLDAVAGARTRAVMPVHFAGQAVAIEPLRAAAPQARIVEDAAHALPASVGGVPTGRLGHAAAFSFYATKSMTTGGRRGACSSPMTTGLGRTGAPDASARDQRRRLEPLRDMGRGATRSSTAASSTTSPISPPPSGSYSSTRLDELRERRVAIAERYDRHLLETAISLELPPRRDGDRSRLAPLRGSPQPRAPDHRPGAGDRGADLGRHRHIRPLHPAAPPPASTRDGTATGPGDFPVAERLFERSISLPTGRR